jgi:hypothetical protein
MATARTLSNGKRTMTELLVCEECHRHVRSNEAHCPFCGADIESSPVAPVTSRRVGRLVVVATVGFALTGTACAYGVPPTPADSGADAADAGDSHAD